MSLPQPPKPAKLIIGLFTHDQELASAAAPLLVEQFGPLDMVSPWFPFDFTDYYEKEMGSPLFRRLLVFKPLIQQDTLADIKLATNAVESQFTLNGCRQINIDPGYLLLERLVLATGKNYAHRIYIGKDIYADLTLIFHNNGFQPLPWTYPDYAHDAIRNFLMMVRKKYRMDLKEPPDDSQHDGFCKP
jgi:hypothetical protein